MAGEIRRVKQSARIFVPSHKTQEEEVVPPTVAIHSGTNGLTASSGTKIGTLFGWQLDKDVPGAWKTSIPFGPGIPLPGSDPGEAFGAVDSDLCAGGAHPGVI